MNSQENSSCGDTGIAHGNDEVALSIRLAGAQLFPPFGYDRIVFTNGCFDLVHSGHLQVLRFAREVAGARGAVVVGVNSDESIQRLKGADRPFVSAVERASLIYHLKMVDYVVIFEEDTPYDLIKALRPHVIVKGGDYSPSEVVGRDISLVMTCPYVDNMSSTSIAERIRGR